jgi:hypothetical protein
MSPNDRRALVRLDFELTRDITWFEELAPKCKEEGLSPTRMVELREAWNVYAEARDWPWWQENVVRCSDEQLQDMVMNAVERLDALGMQKWREVQSEYTQLLTEASGHPANDNEKGIDR